MFQEREFLKRCVIASSPETPASLGGSLNGSHGEPQVEAVRQKHVPARL